jgi:cytoskeletal protein CcmA (bactofilin family)
MWEDRKQTNTNNPTATPTSNTTTITPTKASMATPHVAVIGQNMLIIGKVQSSEDLYVDGEVRGTLEADNCRLTIGPHGKANAGARAREVDVMGRIDGNVVTQEKISIRKGGQLVGDIKAAGIVIEDGAYFKGSIDIVRRAPEVVSLKETA